jgi:hypothetical protein
VRDTNPNRKVKVRLRKIAGAFFAGILSRVPYSTEFCKDRVHSGEPPHLISVGEVAAVPLFAGKRIE